MTGADVGSTATRHDVILGRAKITVKDLSATPKADVSFTSVRNAKRGHGSRRHRRGPTSVSRTGRSPTGSDGDYISGTFYGPAHEEVGGVFEKSSLAGAFGASWNTLTAGSLTWAVSAATARTRAGMSASALTNDAALTTLDSTIVTATDGFPAQRHPGLYRERLREFRARRDHVLRQHVHARVQQLPLRRLQGRPPASLGP